jgi:DNA-binding MarR family transcriptional regulator
MTAVEPVSIGPREEALEDLRLALQELLAAHRRLRSRDGRQTGTIGFAHLRLLGALRRDGSLTASGLATAADLSPATITEMLDVLVAAGFVERQRDDADRRVVRIALTPTGRKAFDAKRARFVAAFSRELADLDAAELAAATVVLRRLESFFDRV